MKRSFQPVSSAVNFPELERKFLSSWYKDSIVTKYLTRNADAKKRFSFLDGPITANNPMGVHHAWGRTYKDLWQRYFTMRGFRQRYQNGFDCQGLWVEVEVEKELGIRNKRDIENLVPNDRKASIATFVEMCKKRVLKYSAVQTEQSKRLGSFMVWDHSYYTMSDENNYMIWHFLATCHRKGWIYKGRDSVPWCPRCQTAISQHEMLTEDYKELTHETVFFKLELLTGSVKGAFLVAWTTTPWTIPANVAVAVNSDYTYNVYELETRERIIVVSPEEMLQEHVSEDVQEQFYLAEIFAGIQGERKKVGELKGKDLVGSTYRGPFDDLPRVQSARRENPKTFHTVVAAKDLVVASKGTGILHVAPGAGQEDFRLSQKEKLPVIDVIADDAGYLDGMEQFSGKNAKVHPELIIDDLRTREGGKFLFKTMPYAHRYPACWRCKTELVWKVTWEWYIAMDRPERKDGTTAGKTLREQMKDVAKMIDWHPAFGLERELDWLTNMQDWLISKKNRYWGLALPIYECAVCGWFDVLEGRDELQRRAVSGWELFDGHSPHKPYIDDVVISCGQCSKPVSRINDVGNVWLDAGIVPFSTYVDPKTAQLSYTTDKKYWQEWFPADFITESFPGQFKNWFYSMIAMATVLEKRNPYKTVLGFASVLGEDGRPMHKSWGNAVEFNEGAEAIGVDVMRWMFVRHNPEHNIRFGYTTADETRRKFHLILWNVYSFFVTYARSDQWSPEAGNGNTKKRSNVLDRWIISRLNHLVASVTERLAAYDAATSAAAIEAFVTDLSQWYVRRSRDRVGPTADNGANKSACYQTLYDVLVTLVKLLAPFTPFLADEIFRNLTGDESVHLAGWPTIEKRDMDETGEEEMRQARQIVELAHAQRKSAGRKVRQPLSLLNATAPALISDGVKNLIRDEINVKKVTIGTGQQITAHVKTDLTPELETEARARDVVRAIQMLRKEKGCTINQQISVTLPHDTKNLPRELVAYIKRKTLARIITWGETLSISTG